MYKMAFTSQEIDDLAAQWAARRNLRDLTPEEQVEFDTWLTADVRHLGAYGRAEAVLARLERVSSVAIGELQARQKATTTDLPRRRFILTGTIAASVAAAGVIGAAFWENSRESGVTTRANFATRVGQTREILLADGSVITLNTDSRVAVELSARARNIRLERGEALFDVAKNKKRPFVVFAGDTQVRAVGTSFTVSMLPKRPIQVLVKEGVVELTHADAKAVAVGAHTRALAPRGSAIVAETVSSTKLARYLAWEYGRIALDNETLQDAATEFARYSGVRIVVDPAVANRTVTGMFASDDPVGFAKAAASVLKLHVEVNDETVRISS